MKHIISTFFIFIFFVIKGYAIPPAPYEDGRPQASLRLEAEDQGVVFDDCASASYGTTYFDGKKWHMFYLGTPHTPECETKNLITQFPKIAADLEGKLMKWNAKLPAPGLPRPIVNQDQLFFDAHVKMNGAKVVKSKK